MANSREILMPQRCDGPFPHNTARTRSRRLCQSMASGFTGDVAKERLPEEMSGVTQLSFSDLVIDESRMLGSGAFSKVYSALLTTAGSEEKTLVAVKKMPIPPIGNKLHKYLSTELRVLRFVHPANARPLH